FSVKEAVFPFIKFPGVDTILGPEMKSTGEVMGIGYSFGEAFVKSQFAAGVRLPRAGQAFISVRDGDKLAAVEIARDLIELGFTLVATRGTAAVIAAHGFPVTTVNKVADGRPHVVDMIKNREVSLIVNTVGETRKAVADSRSACAGMRYVAALEPYALQALHTGLHGGPSAQAPKPNSSVVI